jgi:uncharacterized protein YigA (DUF484 family)
MSRGTSQRQEAETMTAVGVEEYLRRHPDFFEDHLELLETLRVPHPTGPAVSLIVRQVQQLRDKNRRLQMQLNEMLQIARDNDTLHQRLHQLALALLDATQLEDALAGLEWGLHEYFQTDFVAVRIVAPAIETAVADLYLSPASPGAELVAAVLESGKPLCAKPETDQTALLFGTHAEHVASCALVPLQHAGLKGLLAIGSRDPDRFTPGMGFLFLTQMGEILSARLAALLQSLV